MKKVTIGILVIIPVIIMLVVSLVSVVVSANMHIGVEEVTLSRTQIDVSIGRVYNINDFLTVTVLPEKATDKSVGWSISGLNCHDSAYQKEYEYRLEQEGESAAKKYAAAYLVDESGNAVDYSTSGLFKVNASCSFTIECRAGQKVATCTVIAIDDKLNAVGVKGDATLKVGESKLLSVELSPVDAIYERIEWISSDNSVLTVDSNGAVKGVNAGSASVTARVYTSSTEYIDSANFTVTVESNVTLLGADVITHTRTLPLSAFGYSASEIIGTVNCEVLGDNIVIADDKNEANFSTANGVCTLFVSDGIEIKNKSLFAYGEDGNYILAVDDFLNLEAVWKSAFKTDEIAPVWSVDNDRVAVVENGKLVGKADGLVKVTVSVGDYSDEITVNVRSKVTSVILDTTAKELTPAGLAREYVIPAYKYANISLGRDLVANYIDVTIIRPVPPTTEIGGFYEAFNFEILENGEASDKGYFVGNRLYFVGDKISEKTSLTVKVTAKYPKYANPDLSSASVDINVVNGVEASDFETLKAGTEDKLNVCLVDDVKYDESIRADYPILTNSKGLYGNGYMLSAEPGQLTNTHGALMICNANDSFVSNATFRANNSDKEIITADDTEGLQGSCIMFGTRGHGHGDYEDGNYTYLSNTRAEYCIFENGNALYKVFTCENSVEGCIFRNSAGVGIYVPTRTWESDIVTVGYSKFSTKNCIMSNLTGMSLSFEYKDYLPGDDREEERNALLASGKNTTYTQLGFLDIYNWQSINSMNLLPADVLGSGSTEMALAQGINAILRDKLLDKSIADYRYEYNREQFFLIGFMSSGVQYPTYLEWTFEDERLTYVTSDILSGFENVLQNEVYLYTYKNTVEDIIPSSTYTINNKLIDRLHGIGVN